MAADMGIARSQFEWADRDADGKITFDELLLVTGNIALHQRTIDRAGIADMHIHRVTHPTPAPSSSGTWWPVRSCGVCSGGENPNSSGEGARRVPHLLGHSREGARRVPHLLGHSPVNVLSITCICWWAEPLLQQQLWGTRSVMPMQRQLHSNGTDEEEKLRVSGLGTMNRYHSGS